MIACPICGHEGVACGGPSHARPIDAAITLETSTMADEHEQIKVHVDDGTTRGYDLMMTRKDAEKYLTINLNAGIAEGQGPAPSGDDDAEMKAQAPAEDKAVRAPARARRTSRAADEQPSEDEGKAPPAEKTEDK